MNEKIVLWGGPDDEDLRHETMDAYIEAVLDETEPVPETIVAVAYGRMPVTIRDGIALDMVLDALDEEYCSHPDGEPTSPTPAMIEAEREFLAAVVREYVPYACVEVSRVTVNVAEWRAARGRMGEKEIYNE